MKKILLLLIIVSFHSIANFSGHWVDKSSSRSLTLDLIEDGGHIIGKYCFITNNGNRIDCAEDSDRNIEGIIKNHVGEVSFVSTFGGVGEATLSMEKNSLVYTITNDAPFINANMSVPSLIYFKRDLLNKVEYHHNDGEDPFVNINRDYTKADKELNELYKTKIQQYKKEGADFYGQAESRDIYLKKSQQVWIKMRDTSCNYETYESRTGTGFSSIYTECLLDKTNERIKYLNQND